MRFSPLLIVYIICNFIISPTEAQYVELLTQNDIDQFDQSIVHFEGTIQIGNYQEGSTSVENLRALRNLKSISGNLIIENHARLNSLEGLNNIGYIGGDLVIKECYKIKSLDGLNSLKVVEKKFWIRSNDSIEMLTGIDSLTSIGGLNIQYNNNLKNMNGLEKLEHIDNDLLFWGNDNLSNLTGLKMVKTIGGSFILSGCKSLENLDGLENIKSINDKWIYNNEISITGCDKLENIDALKSLTGFGGEIYIVNNNSLRDISGLRGLEFIIWHLTIMDNSLLTSLKGLENLRNVNGNLIIERNFALKDISALVHLSSVGRQLKIMNNPNLEDCCTVRPLINQRIEDEQQIFISNNKRGCNSEFELQSNGDCDSTITSEIYSTGNLNFLSQGEIDSFNTNITQINGNLHIGNYLLTDINNLYRLRNIESINGDLVISKTSLESLNHLNIRIIRGSLIILENKNLLNLNGLHSLSRIGQTLSINGNDVLKSIAELENISSLYASLEIKSNNNLLSLNGLHNLNSIGDNLIISHNDGLQKIQSLSKLENVIGGLEIIENQNLESLNGLNNIKYVQEEFVISSNQSIKNLVGIESLTELRDDLIISDNSQLVTTSGIKGLKIVKGDVHINDNTSLKDVNGFEKLSSVLRGLHIYNNPLLKELSGLNGLKFLFSTLYIHNNPSLIDLMGLLNLDNEIFDLTISNNDSLIDFRGISNIREVKSDVRIINNNLIKTLDGINKKDSKTSYGLIHIEGNPRLEDISAFQHLESISSFTIKDNEVLQEIPNYRAHHISTIKIEENPNLIDLSGLSNLTFCRNAHIIGNQKLAYVSFLKNIQSFEILDISNNENLKTLNFDNLLSVGSPETGLFKISGNKSLKNLDGFYNFQRITPAYDYNRYEYIPNELEISNNDSLLHLDGLRQLEYVGGHLRIFENSQLIDCCAIAKLVADPDAILGETQIKNNPSACSSVEEILESCISSTFSTNDLAEFYIYPNPTSHTFFYTSDYVIKRIKIINTMGQPVLNISNPNTNKISIDHLTSGMYYVTFTDNKNSTLFSTLVIE